MKKESKSNIENEFKCFCGEWRFKNAFFVVDEVREKVCRDLPFYNEIDGKTYCVLHFPSKNKIEDFNNVLDERFKEDEWDFRMVFFPSPIKFKDTKLTKETDFGHATFAETVDFYNCEFENRFSFFDSIFLEDAKFDASKFQSQVNFNTAKFQKFSSFILTEFHFDYPTPFNQTTFYATQFLEAKFCAGADFKKAEFKELIDFRKTKFIGEADFIDSKFPISGKTNFDAVEFYKTVNFTNVEFFNASFRETKFGIEEFISNKILFLDCKFRKAVTFFCAEFFAKADFYGAEFDNVHFEYAKFNCGADFSICEFKEDGFFNETEFGIKTNTLYRTGDVYFKGTLFGDNSRIYFENTWFSRHLDFDCAYLKGFIFFSGHKTNQVFDNIFEESSFPRLLHFLNTTIEKPEKIQFKDLRLRPSWLINIDCRKFLFFNINWKNEKNEDITIVGELRNIEVATKTDAKKLLASVFRQLGENAENNNRFDEASKFRRMAFETEWIEKKEKIKNWFNNLLPESEKLKRRFGGSTDEEDKPIPPTNSFGILRRSGDFIIHLLYRITSFYGESWSWAFTFLLLLILLIFPIGYSISEFQVTPNNIPLGIVVNGCKDVVEELKPICKIENRELHFFSEAIPHSLAIATLQNVEYRVPRTTAGYIWTILEKIFAPLQAALLALAIRRKFMR